MQYKSFLKKILSIEEFENFLTQYPVDKMEDGALTEALMDQGVLLMIDWSSEEEPYQIEKFIKTRVKQLSDSSIEAIFSDPYPDFLKKTDVEKGDIIPYLIEFYDDILRKKKYQIMQIETGADFYWLLLTTCKDGTRLKKIENDFWKFKDKNSTPKEVDYTIYCPSCNHMCVWTLDLVGDGEEIIQLAGETCDCCGLLFFDDEGNALVKFEKSYV